MSEPPHGLQWGSHRAAQNRAKSDLSRLVALWGKASSCGSSDRFDLPELWQQSPRLARKSDKREARKRCRDHRVLSPARPHSAARLSQAARDGRPMQDLVTADGVGASSRRCGSAQKRGVPRDAPFPRWQWPQAIAHDVIASLFPRSGCDPCGSRPPRPPSADPAASWRLYRRFPGPPHQTPDRSRAWPSRPRRGNPCP